MKFKIFVLIFVSFLSACAGNLLKPVSLAADEREKIRNSGPVTVTMQETPGFMFNTPSGALVDAGMARWKDPENAPSWPRITALHNVPDFTKAVRDKFVSTLEKGNSAYNFVAAKAREPFGYKEETGYTGKYNTKYVLEFRTQYGSFSYGPLSWKTYMMNYFGQARIIRVMDKQVVWKANCSIKSSENPLLQVPAEDFLSGNGKQLKSAAAFTTSTCAKQLLQDFMGQ